MSSTPVHQRAYFAGVGSRRTPASVCRVMTGVARAMARRGVALRSGAAEGADSAFERGADEHAQIFLPWRGYNRHPSPLHAPSDLAARVAERHHPAWHACSRAARLLHARNTHIVLGPDCMDRSTAVVCWTADGQDSGGTGQALRVARAWRVPVFNLWHREQLELLREYVYGKAVVREEA